MKDFMEICKALIKMNVEKNGGKKKSKCGEDHMRWGRQAEKH